MPCTAVQRTEKGGYKHDGGAFFDSIAALLQSDNFQTFHSASQFRKLLCNNHKFTVVQDQIAQEGIDWKFITERSLCCIDYW
ncbi:hypothetical protein T07_13927 [Trichinella nelsoni]|uniref:Uncharacterized protein n=1 Tax=Trichinella nelsoni TaxID=6336 RepID=A0A0V0RE24_9BILA|nr:hypothetical protein T07_14638 [Trichinella nelsoni]KRX12753.1 hypothetical protein T07_13927 [Trichinella nelsoni]